MTDLIRGFAGIVSITLIRYFLIAGLVFVVVYWWLPRLLHNSKIQQRVAVRKDFMREIINSVLSSIFIAIAAMIALSGSLRPYTRIYTDIDAYAWWWMPLSLLLCLIIHDTYFYWMHRLLHHKRVFTITHVVHHQSTNPSPWAAYSFHFIEAFLEGAVVIVLVFLLPVHVGTLMLFAFISFAINVYGHMGYEVMPKWFRRTVLFEVVNTSTYHNLHHSKFKGNYGLYFRVWDRLMGTENPDYVKEYDKIQARRFGG
jgi:Delta7-sterol 5-desaturase